MIVLACGVYKLGYYTIPQALKLHIYLGYYMLGMALYDLTVFFKKKNNIYLIVTGISIIVTSIVYGIMCSKSEFNPDYHYGTWYYTPWISSLLLFFSGINVKNKYATTIIKTISDNTFCVYLGHIPLVFMYIEYKPIDKMSQAILLLLLLFISLNIIAEIFKRLPILRRLV